MNINLFKINKMKKVGRWLDVSSVAIDLWEQYNPIGKIYLGLEKRQQTADARDKFVRTRMKTRPGWRMMFLRYEQSSKALDLINYILKRYLRSKK